VLFIMLTGKQPFKLAAAENCGAYAAYLRHGFGSMDSAKDLLGDAAELLEGMLNPNPKLRLTMSEAFGSSWLSGVQSPLKNVRKWSEVLGYEGLRKKDATKFSSGETHASTRCPSSSPRSDVESLSFLSRSPSLSFTQSHTSVQVSSPMKHGDTANDMLVRTLGWVELAAPKERLVEQVTDVLEGLGIEYSVARGELSHVVKVQVPCDNGDDASSDSDSSSTCASVSDASPGPRTHMAGQLSVQLEIHARSPSKSDFHITRQSGSVLRFHSFYHDLKNQLAGSNGWDEDAGRYLRIPESQ